MSGIPFTQYLLPNGRRKDVVIDRSAEVEEIAARLIADGARFEAELLNTGEVSFTCERDGEDDEPMVLAIEVCANGPAVPEAVDRLVRAAALVEPERFAPHSGSTPTSAAPLSPSTPKEDV